MAAGQAGLLGMIYGPSGIGKTTAAVAAFPRAKYIAYPRAVRVSEAVFGFKIPPENIIVAENLSQACTVIEAELKKGNDVVADDISPMAEYSLDDYRKKKSGYDVFNAVTTDLLHIRRAVEQTTQMVLMSAHLGQPHLNNLNNRTIRGGPRLPGQTPELIVTAFDLILRLDVDNTRAMGLPKSLICLPDASDYIYKDRHNVVIGSVPANLREVLIAAGYQLKRPPGMEWMDQAVTNIVANIEARIASKQLAESALNTKAVMGPLMALFRTAIEQQYSKIVEQQNWVLMDAFDRVVLNIHRRSRSRGASSFLGG